MSSMLVTGASGFVGRMLCHTLVDAGVQVRAAVRRSTAALPGEIEQVLVGDIDGRTEWGEALRGIDTIVHAAARAHIMNARPADIALYGETNAKGTARLVQAAVQAGVRRFVYVSSIKVNGEGRRIGPYRADDPTDPKDAYAISKSLGEAALLETGGSMQTAIVRPPLVYGPGVRANFLRLMRWIDQELPLPLGAIHNRRSLVSVWNLCDLLRLLAIEPIPSGRAWLVSDGEDLSTAALIRRIAFAMHKDVRLLPVPEFLLKLGGTLVGRKDQVARLCDSLTVDTSATREQLKWSPPLSVEESIDLTVQWYLREGRSSAG